MEYFATPTSVGVWETFLVLALLYFVFMMGGALGYRVPALGWRPEGWTPPVKRGHAMIRTAGPFGRGDEDSAILADLGGADA